MNATINALHAIVNRRLWFNTTFAALTVVGYAAQSGVHFTGGGSLGTDIAFTAFHSVVFFGWFFHQPKRRAARHRVVAA